MARLEKPPSVLVEQLRNRFKILRLNCVSGRSVMISPDRPAHEMRQIVEAIIEQLTTIKVAEVRLRLEIDAEVPDGIDRSKVRTLLENANTLGFLDKLVK